FQFVVCYGSFEQLVNVRQRTEMGERPETSLKSLNYCSSHATWNGCFENWKEQELYFLDATRLQKRLKHVLNQQFERPHRWINPTEFEGWAETVMPHYDLRAVIYESHYKRVRTEAHLGNTIRYIISTLMNIGKIILMEKFYHLLRKYLL
ncbi:hypothetical protein PMAYCL1PPCAC_31555, partial [Pristionchus mayeri]